MRLALVATLALAAVTARAQTELSDQPFAYAVAGAATYSAAVSSDDNGRETLLAYVASVEASSRRAGGALSYVIPSGAAAYSDASRAVAVTGFVFLGPGRGGDQVTALSLTGQRTVGGTSSLHLWALSPALSVSRRVLRTAVCDIAPQATIGGNVVFVEGNSEGVRSLGGVVGGGLAIAFDSVEFRTVLTPEVTYAGISGAEKGAVSVGLWLSVMSHYAR